MKKQKTIKTKKPRTFKERRIYYFPCKACLKPHRSSHKMAKANDGLCQKCRRGEQVNKNQMRLIPEPMSKCSAYQDGHHFTPLNNRPSVCACGEEES